MFIKPPRKHLAKKIAQFVFIVFVFQPYAIFFSPFVGISMARTLYLNESQATYRQLLVALSWALRKETISSGYTVHFTFISITLDILESKNLPSSPPYKTIQLRFNFFFYTINICFRLGWKRSNYFFFQVLLLSQKLYRGMKMDHVPVKLIKKNKQAILSPLIL